MTIYYSVNEVTFSLTHFNLREKRVLQIIFKKNEKNKKISVDDKEKSIT